MTKIQKNHLARCAELQKLLRKLRYHTETTRSLADLKNRYCTQVNAFRTAASVLIESPKRFTNSPKALETALHTLNQQQENADLSYATTEREHWKHTEEQVRCQEEVDRLTKLLHNELTCGPTLP